MKIGAMNHPARNPLEEIDWFGRGSIPDAAERRAAPQIGARVMKVHWGPHPEARPNGRRSRAARTARGVDHPLDDGQEMAASRCCGAR